MRLWDISTEVRNSDEELLCCSFLLISALVVKGKLSFELMIGNLHRVPCSRKPKAVWATRFPGLEVPEKHKRPYCRCGRLVTISASTAARAGA
jgi:hypothetical protein